MYFSRLLVIDGIIGRFGTCILFLGAAGSSCRRNLILEDALDRTLTGGAEQFRSRRRCALGRCRRRYLHDLRPSSIPFGGLHGPLVLQLLRCLDLLADLPSLLLQLAPFVGMGQGGRRWRSSRRRFWSGDLDGGVHLLLAFEEHRLLAAGCWCWL